MSTTAISELIKTKQYNPIGPIGNNKINPIGNKPQTNVIVDQLLVDYQDLIEPSFKSWFAGRFRAIPFDQLHRFASEARQEGTNPKRLFAYKVAHYSGV